MSVQINAPWKRSLSCHDEPPRIFSNWTWTEAATVSFVYFYVEITAFASNSVEIIHLSSLLQNIKLFTALHE